MTHQPLTIQASLATLFVLQLTMLGALFTQTVPHPPLQVPPFALGPFLGAALSITVAAFIFSGSLNRTGIMLSILAAMLALVSFGPQKWVDPAIGQIWPAVLTGQIAVLVVVVQAVNWLRAASKHEYSGAAR